MATLAYIELLRTSNILLQVSNTYTWRKNQLGIVHAPNIIDRASAIKFYDVKLLLPLILCKSG